MTTGAPPHLREQVLVREGLISVSHQEFEERPLLLAQADILAVTSHAMTREIDRKPLNANNVLHSVS